MNSDKKLDVATPYNAEPALTWKKDENGRWVEQHSFTDKITGAFVATRDAVSHAASKAYEKVAEATHIVADKASSATHMVSDKAHSLTAPNLDKEGTWKKDASGRWVNQDQLSITDKMGGKFASARDKVSGAASKAYQQAANLVSSKQDSTITTTTTTTSSTGLDNSGPSLTQKAKDAGASMKESAQNAGASMKESAQNAGAAIKDKAQGAADTIKSQVGALTASTSSANQGDSSSWKQDSWGAESKDSSLELSAPTMSSGFSSTSAFDNERFGLGSDNTSSLSSGMNNLNLGSSTGFSSGLDSGLSSGFGSSGFNNSSSLSTGLLDTGLGSASGFGSSSLNTGFDSGLNKSQGLSSGFNSDKFGSLLDQGQQTQGAKTRLQDQDLLSNNARF